MTADKIASKHGRAAIVFDCAKKIRLLLDEAQSAYGQEWEDDSAQDEILNLVTEDE
jgi:hypothetical protein